MINVSFRKKIVQNLFLISVGIFGYILFQGTLVAETVTGGGYVVEQSITPLQGGLSGNGYIVQQSAQPLGGTQTGGGYVVQGVYGTGTSSVATTPPPSPPPPIIIYAQNGMGYYMMPPQATGTSDTSTPVDNGDNRSTCSTRTVFSGPIDIGLSTNNKADVIKLERFLNDYENAKLPVNGIYEKRDVDAVKKWQAKYKSFILDPMGLKKPTGTVYTLSQRQIERQTTARCGQPIVVTACPYFKEYASYGDRGDVVKKVQLFLNIVRGEKLPTSGVYGPLTRDAVKRFQRASRQGFFDAFRFGFISGNWNEATRIKANQAIGCDITK